MLRSTITIDLPSAEVKHQTTSFREWVRSLFPEALSEGERVELLTAEASTLLRELVAGLKAAGVTDAISLVINQEVVYVDASEVDADLDAMMEAASKSAALSAPFESLSLTMSLKQGGLHTIFDVQIVNAVKLGDAEMQVRLSSRLTSQRPRAGERAEDYAARLGRSLSDEGLREAIDTHDSLTLALGEALREVISGGLVHVEFTRVRLLKPDAGVMATFPALTFGDDVVKVDYRPAPIEAQEGAYDDPYLHAYHDPYFELTCALVLRFAGEKGVWHAPEVEVIDVEGGLLCVGEAIEPQADVLSSLGALSLNDSVSVAPTLIADVSPRPAPTVRQWAKGAGPARRGFVAPEA